MSPQLYFVALGLVIVTVHDCFSAYSDGQFVYEPSWNGFR